MARKPWPSHVLRADTAEALVGINSDAFTMALWPRTFCDALAAEIDSLPIAAYPNVRLITDEPATDIRAAFVESARVAGVPVPELLCADVIAQAECYRTVTGLNRILVRIERITTPRRRYLHVDGVSLRLLTTYRGLGTRWLANADVKRDGLNKGNDAGVYRKRSDVRRLANGHVSLMKGEMWPDNEGNGLVHGEPCPHTPAQHRMSLVIDDARNTPSDPERLIRFLLATQ